MRSANKDEVLLSVRDLSVEFHQAGESQTAVDHISFDIKRGETVALVGESGSGKSVSALSVLRLLPYPAASHPSGQILFKGQDLLSAPEPEIREVRGNDITMIFQEPMTSLNPLQTVEKQISEILHLHQQIRPDEARRQVLDLLDQVGIREPRKRLASYPHQLSGGQRQRVMIAMALANRPELLIADEPTTALDVTVQAQILELLRRAEDRARDGHAVHHPRPGHRAQVRRPGLRDDRWQDRRNRTDSGNLRQSAACLHQAPARRRTQGRAAQAQAIRARGDAGPRHQGLVSGQAGVSQAYRGSRQGGGRAVTFPAAGQTLGVVGESGSGKTTLGLALMRLIRSEGEIHFNRLPLHERSFKQMRSLRSSMQVVFQDPFGSLSPRMSIADIVGEGLAIHARDLSAQARPPRCRRARGSRARRLDALAVSARVFRRPAAAHRDCTGHGAQAPFRDAGRADLRARHERSGAGGRSAARPARRHDLAYLFISHDLKVVRALANDVIVMRAGKVVEQGTADQIFDHPTTEYTKALMAAAFNLEAASGGAVSE
jgi:microcin C transport system ATP-binding protein